jgi:uncharacterized protein (DUF2141 family)
MTHYPARRQPRTQVRRPSIAYPAAYPAERRAGTVALAMALLAITVPAALAAAPPAPAPASLTVRFHGLKSLSGALMFTLAASPEAYAGKAPVAAQVGVEVTGDVVEITFAPLKPGTYAIKAFHDLNGDGKMNANPFGIPTEPFAFSNDAHGLMGPPEWEAAAFAVKAGANRQTIDID